MRQRVVRLALTASLVAVILLALPLGWAIRSSLYADQRDTLERAALSAAVRVGPDFTSGDPIELPNPPAHVVLGVYDDHNRLRSGSGPDTGDTLTDQTRNGDVHRGEAAGRSVVAIPVTHAESVIGVVRAAAPLSTVRTEVLLAWSALVGIAGFALAVAVLTARRQARALAAPLEALSSNCRAVAEGDLTARAEPSTIDEIDQVARTHNDMLQNLSELLRRERDFNANASHQLRTPLTGLQLTLEAALEQDTAPQLRSAVDEALTTTRRLHQTVEEVLQLTRGSAWQSETGRAPLAAVLEAAEQRWRGPLADEGRRLSIDPADTPVDAQVPAGTVAEILDVLLDNARRHGAGTVQMAVRDFDQAVAVDVRDEGIITADAERIFQRGHSSGGTGAGLGLAIARDLATATGGRLYLASKDPTTFTLLLLVPGAQVDQP
ncbi:histidine kinase dimerization/phospho-acceptor domain-containing protein [Streptomyces sp. NPDC058045]|uniref:HAMP domain-containing sensor histidine kinase n=1 Tax=Streptomyces sp. NPDC058045 TaxID=3346311 RepID=UPI0036EFE6B2